MAVLHGNVVDLRNVACNVKDNKSHNVETTAFVLDFSDKAGCKTVVVEEAVVAIDGPVGEMMPGSLDIDYPIDVAFADLTNSDLQCFHEQSPRPSCARIT